MGRSLFELDATGPFDFEGTAYSHGWVVLDPNAWDAERGRMERTHRLPSGRVVRAEIGDRPGPDPGVVVTVDCGQGLSPDEEESLRAAVRRMFRLDEDLSVFYELCSERGDPWIRVTRGLGRLLRSPTVFEDVVKTICTTNVQWGGTRRMVRQLVEDLGEPHREAGDADGSSGGRAFPRPEAIAALSVDAFSERVGLGYRAPYVHALATRVASGALELEAMADADLATDELKRELLGIKGVGEYAASTLLMLLGRYDELPVDSVCRTFVTEKYFAGEQPPDDAIRSVYEEWGEWRYLAYWFDLWEGVEEEL